MRLGKPRFSKGEAERQIETICPVDDRAFAEACERFDIDLTRKLSKNADARRSLTNLANLVFSE